MGCNSSKRADIRRDRVRRSQSEQPQFSTIFNSSNVNIPNQPTAPKENTIYGTSYTNRKTAEFELLNDIVRATRSNFIEHSMKHLSDDERQEDEIIESELQHREQIYANKLRQQDEQLNSSNRNKFSKSQSTLTKLPDEFEFINHYHQMTHPLSPEFNVKSAGQLVLTFEEL